MVEWRLGCRAVGVLRLIILALSARRVRSAVTCAPNLFHSALLPARRRGSTRDGRRTDDTGGQAWQRLPFLYKLCSILSGIVEHPKARSLLIKMKEDLELQGRITAADFRGPGVKHIYALCDRIAYEPLLESEDSFSNDMSSSSRRSCLPRGFYIGFQNTLPEAWYGNGNGEPY